jgi:hypothetical protein
VHNDSTSPTLRVDVAGAIIFHSLSSFLEGRERRGSPQSRLFQGLYFVGLARTLPPLPIHHPLVFSKKLLRIPEETPLKKVGWKVST